MQKVTEKVETITTKKTTIYCDDCGELTFTLTSRGKCCTMCGADLCHNCFGDEEWDTGDYSTVYCKPCWDIGTSYREKIAMLNRDIEIEEDEWKAAGKRIRQSKHDNTV
jgi:hypothetical protein